MAIISLHLRHFRNYNDASFAFSEQVTAIVGPNGSGKTNILEALHIIASGKSFRDSDEDLIQHGEEWWTLSAELANQTRQVKFSPGQKEFRINDKIFKRLGRQQSIPVVLFEPDHLSLVHGSPSARRKYLDQTIAQTTQGYSTLLRRYDRVLAQRNRLLKMPRADHDQLFVWDVSLAELAAEIVTRRHTQLNFWQDNLSHEYRQISHDKANISAVYSAASHQDNYAHWLMAHLKASLERDLLIGSTSAGPHRDDYEFYMNNRPMTTVASRGEVRTLLLALKQLEARQLYEHYHEHPLLLLDDVFSELDESRQRHLLTTQRDNQIVITTTSGDNIFGDGRIIALSLG